MAAARGGLGYALDDEEFLAGHDLHPPVRTLGSNGAIKQAARAGLGVSLQARLVTRLELKLGLLATVPLDVRCRWGSGT